MLLADDTNVFIQGSNIVLKYAAEQFMQQLTVWFQNNKTLNINKTHFSIFKNGNIKIPQ